MSQRKDAGDAAEAEACRYLENQGLVLVEKNFRCRGGEIDLVMQDGAVVALVEVRLRSRSFFGGAAASVGWKKQQRLVTAARYLLLTRAQLRSRPLRFDVVTFEPDDGRLVLRWIRDAFRL